MTEVEPGSCKNVTWYQCELKEVEKTIPITRFNCSEGDILLEYDKCINTFQDFMVTELNCEVKDAVNCVSKEQEKCAEICYE